MGKSTVIQRSLGLISAVILSVSGSGLATPVTDAFSGTSLDSASALTSQFPSHQLERNESSNDQSQVVELLGDEEFVDAIEEAFGTDGAATVSLPLGIDIDLVNEAIDLITEGLEPSEELGAASPFPEEAWQTTEAVIVAASSNPIQNIWSDRQNVRIVLRKNAKTKIADKHNLAWQTVRSAMKDSNVVKTHEGGTRYRYRTQKARFACNLVSCWIAETKIIRTVVDRRQYAGSTYGVVTSYCEGVTRCPSWIN